MNPGIYTDIPADDYHTTQALSKGGLVQFSRSPAHFRAMTYDPSGGDTPAQVIGSAFHARVLEPEVWLQEWVVMPSEIDRRTKDG